MDTNNQDNNYETTTVTPVDTNEVPVEQPIQEETQNTVVEQPVQEQPVQPVAEPVQPVVPQPVEPQPVQQPVIPQQPVQPVVQEQPIVQPQPTVPVATVQPKKSGAGIKIGIIAFLLLIIIGLFIAVLVIVLNGNKDLRNIKNPSRTIMIYMVGSDLEDAGMASVELRDLDYSKLSSEKVNVVLMIGGAKKWRTDYVNVDETSIYELKPEGVTKVKEIKKSNMGGPETLSTFLNYTYENYKTDRYSLVFWDHGGGFLGGEVDVLFNNDNLDISEYKKAFKNSPFNEKNKLETIYFSTCLNGTIEIMSTFADYADYMVASEETTMSVPTEGDIQFVHKISEKDDGYETSYKFLDTYKTKMESYYGSKLHTKAYNTYSIVDLQYTKELTNAINDFFTSIDVSQNYNRIAKVRSSLYEYGYMEKYRTSEAQQVDLYNLVNGLRDLNPEKADKIIELVNKYVKYNWSTDDRSKGISIVFPYNVINSNHLNFLIDEYAPVTDLDPYKKFMVKFNTIKNDSSYNYSFSKNQTTLGPSDTGKADFVLEMTDEQATSFARADFMVFRSEGNGYYLPIYRGKAEEDSKVLKATIADRQLKIIDKADGTGGVITLRELDSSSNYIKYITSAILQNFQDYDNMVMDNVTVTLVYDKSTGKISMESVVLNSTTDSITTSLPNRVVADLSKYDSIAFGSSSYKILDSKGEYNPDWESNGIFKGYETKLNNLDFEVQDLNDGHEYYAVFAIYDTANNIHYSKLVKMN